MGWETDYVVSVYPPPPRTIHPPHRIPRILEESVIVLRRLRIHYNNIVSLTRWYRSKPTKYPGAGFLAPRDQTGPAGWGGNKTLRKWSLNSSWPLEGCLLSTHQQYELSMLKLLSWSVLRTPLCLCLPPS